MIACALITLLAFAEALLVMAAAVFGRQKAALATEVATPPNSDGKAKPFSRLPWLRAAEGCLLGAFLGIVGTMLGLEWILNTDDLVTYFGAAGIVIALFRGRRLLRVLVSLALLLLVLVTCTSMPALLVRSLFRSDPLRPAPAIVVLASSLYSGDTMSASAQFRSLHAYELTHQGSAPTILVANSRRDGSQAGLMRRQLRDIGLECRVEEMGFAQNTHDEALLVADIAKRRGWSTVILVTQPWHMRRAAATFEKTGLHVVCSPCREGTYDLGRVDMSGERVDAFRDWLHEWIGYQVYRARGWL